MSVKGALTSAYNNTIVAAARYVRDKIVPDFSDAWDVDLTR